MIISGQTQFYILLYSILAGVLTGVLFDLYRVIRGFQSSNKVVTFIEDVLFWIAASMIVFIFMLITNYAYISLYIYLYIGVGLFIYLKLVSHYFICIQHNIVKTLLKIIRISINIVLYPFELIFNIKRK